MVTNAAKSVTLMSACRSGYQQALQTEHTGKRKTLLDIVAKTTKGVPCVLTEGLTTEELAQEERAQAMQEPISAGEGWRRKGFRERGGSC